MDFALILFVALLVTGGIWLLDRFYLAARRRQAAVTDSGEQRPLKDPLIIEYSKAFFPVILIVFLLRSFVAEPFRIPSGSMLPTLNIGDFILVNKFSYGLRLPVVNAKVVQLSDPQRGDIMVFRFPHDDKMHFVKRVVGLPGDRIGYRDEVLYINGEAVEQVANGTYDFRNGFRRDVKVERLVEKLDGIEHDILIDRQRQSPNQEVVVPEGHYFVMGDNRNYSNDSRFWGFVPDKNVVGEAFFIWFAWDAANGGGVNWSRIGTTL